MPSWSRSRAARLLRATLLPVLSTVLFLGVLTATPAHAAAGEVSVDMVINKNGVETRTETIAAGASRLFVVKYSCSSSDCDNVRITLPLAAHTSISNVVHGADLTESRSGSVVTWSAESLAAGVTSQVTFTLSVAGGAVSDGTVVTHQAAISAFGAASRSSDPVSMTVRSDGTTSAALEMTAGGSTDAWTSYAVRACLHAPSDATFGQLGVQGGSSLVLTLPTGATLRSGDGASVSGRTLTWTVGALTTAGCQTKVVKVEYLSSENAVGAAKTLDLAWTGAMLGRAQATLGTDALTRALDAPGRATGRLEASISPSRQQVGDNVVADYYVGNQSNTVWRSVEVDAGLSTDQRTTSIYAATGRTPGSLWIAVDGGPLTKVADIAAGASVTLDPYAATLPLGGPGLGAGQTVTAVRAVVGGLQPGEGFGALNLTSKVLATTTDGTPVVVGDQFAMTGGFTLDDGIGDPYEKDAPLSYTVYQPQPVVTVRAGGGGTIANGASTTMNFIGFVGADDLVDPVFTVRLPAALTYQSWAPDATTLPTPTMTKLADTPNAGQTLLRFTWPRGTTIPRDSYWSVNVTSKLGEKAYGGHQAKGFVSSATAGYDCGDGWFVEGADTPDLDGNGNTSRALCAWGAGVEPITNVSAALVQSIKGSWDADFSAGPSTSYTSPGSPDTLRAELQNNGNIFLKNAVVVTRLPRPGDTAILSGSPRNPATGTFPVVLRGQPVVPTLGSPVATLWTTEANPCLPEVGSSPQDCADPEWTRWSDTAPSSLAAVTALKFDFGGNQLTPFTSWTVDIPVTTPTSGATETDFAVANPLPNDPDSDEYAVATSAAIATRSDISSTLNTIESTPVRLDMPGGDGPYSPPAPVDLTSTAAVGQPQSVTVDVPTGGTVSLVGPGGPTNRVEVAGEGAYVLDPATGVISFVAEPGFVGRASAVTYTVTDAYAVSATATYKARITAPLPPAPADATTSGVGPAVQTTTFTVPSGGSVRLVDQDLAVIGSHTVTVPGVGTYVLTPATGVVTFTPVSGYVGTPAGVQVVVTDSAGQQGYATYVPTITLPAVPPTGELSTQGTGTSGQHVTVTRAPGTTVTLVDGEGHDVTEVVLPGVGTYTLDPATGVITFVPVLGFSGQPDPVTYAVTDGYGQRQTASYAPTVAAPPAPATRSQQTRGQSGRVQQVAVTVPVGGTAALWNGTEAVESITVAGQGTYSLVNGVLRFTPVAGFAGTAAPVAFQVTDAYGQTARATYQATVAERVVTPGTPVVHGGAKPSTEHGRRGRPVTLAPLAKVHAPAGQRIVRGSLRLHLERGSAARRGLRTAEGTWRVNPGTGKVVFRPAADFVGVTTVHFSVRTSAGRVYRSTVSVVVTGAVTGRASTTVYFGIRSAHLTRAALGRLRALAAQVPDRATSAALSVGYVQPEPYTGNDLSLSRARARAAAAALSRMTDIDRVRLAARGRAEQQDWRARRATVTVRWRLVQR